MLWLTMAKWSRKLSTRCKKDRGGCMWNLVSKLRSRGSGLTQKLLFDQKRCTEAAAGHGVSRTNFNLMIGLDANVQDSESTESMAMAGKPSVKMLVEEEMIFEEDAEWINSLKHGKRSCDRVMDDDNESSCNRSDEQGSSDDMRDIMEYLGSLSRQRSGIWEEHDKLGDEEKFSRAFSKTLSRQLVNGRQLSEDEMICCSKVFVNMLLILNSADFSLLELMRYPEAMLKRCMEILREHQLGRSFSKRSSAKLMSSEDGGERFQMNVGSPLVPSRIVILKPWMMELPKPAKALNPGISRGIERSGTKRQKKKSSAPGFLRGIKRKLKAMVAKESADESADRICEKSRKGHSRRESLKKNRFGQDFKHEPTGISFRTNKYLSKAITGDDDDTSSSSQDPETMGMILLHPELNCSNRTSTGRRWEYGAVNGSSSRIVCDKWRKPEFTWVAETGMYAFKFLDGAGTKVISDATEQSSQGMESSDGLLKIEKSDSLDIAVNLPEWSSPVSFLEPHFPNDNISPAISERGAPARDFCSSAEFPRRHLETELEEDDYICVDETDTRERTIEEDTGLVLDRVAALLWTSNLTWEDLYLKSQSSNQLLEPSLLRDQHLFKDDGKLLVDCVNEVLSEACALFIGRSCLSLAGQRIKPVPSMDFTVHEVCRGVRWHLDPIPQPCSLEQIVGKDMSRTGSWMDLAHEGESTGLELCDAIFSELVDEVAPSAEVTNVVAIQ